MANRKNHTYGRGTKHLAEHGNTVTEALLVEVGAQDAADDVLFLDEFPAGFLYTDVKVASEGATGALTLDVGVRSQDKGATLDDDDYFATAQAAQTAGTAVANNFNHPLYVEASGAAIRHDLTVTLGGVVTEGDRFWVIVEGVAYSR